MESEIPLQAADVLCWHIQRYFSGVFDRTLEDRWYLLKERTGVMHYWKREELEATSRDLVTAGLTR